MVMMGAECIQCGGSISPTEKHLCNKVPTIGNAAAHAAQIQRDDPKEEYEGAAFNNAKPVKAEYEYLHPEPITNSLGLANSGMRINRIVTDIELPCETCGEYVVYKPVAHKCKEHD